MDSTGDNTIAQFSRSENPADSAFDFNSDTFRPSFADDDCSFRFVNCSFRLIDRKPQPLPKFKHYQHLKAEKKRAHRDCHCQKRSSPSFHRSRIFDSSIHMHPELMLGQIRKLKKRFPISKYLVPPLRIQEDIAAGDESLTHSKIQIKHGALLKFFLTKSDKIILHEACWAISYITAGTSAQIQAVIDVDLISPLVRLTKSEFDDIRKEAARAIANATSQGTLEQIWFMASKGCIEALCDLLTYSDPSTLTVCLAGLLNMLNAGEINKEKELCNRVNIYVQMVEKCRGLDKIIRLRSYDNSDIHKRAVAILEKYWPEDLETVDDFHNSVGGSSEG